MNVKTLHVTNSNNAASGGTPSICNFKPRGWPSSMRTFPARLLRPPKPYKPQTRAGRHRCPLSQCAQKDNRRCNLDVRVTYD
jgi:hypothetical protein